ncbi:DUF829-domain-containing protein [Aspergillus avenaceus]|uniref:DUF829-domain-containing protein n=1 Tax=Aspergillus avenaceus TaxID=36643 RepID=A0A5N6U312_ASPAV|nr:DUF829-domain-containing protein [Aspergillus avenaceus]
MTLSWASLSEFRKLSDGIYIYDPKLEPNGHVVAGHNEQGPSTIILFTWADASVRLISKYFEGYRTLYPSAKIIVVTATTMKTFFAGPEDAKSFVKPMVEKELSPIISNIGSSSGAASTPEGSLNLRREKERGVLVHAFSNSGGLNLEAVWSVWHALQISQGQSIGPLPIHGLILDSTPGGPSFRREFGRWTAGVAMGFAFLPKICAKLVATLIVLVLMGIPNLLGKESLAARGRRVLNSPQNIPLNSARLYIYSDSDLLIGHSDVESHAQDARDKGYKKVKLERFSGSGHVAHMRQDPKRYWATISKFWDECCV